MADFHLSGEEHSLIRAARAALPSIKVTGELGAMRVPLIQIVNCMVFEEPKALDDFLKILFWHISQWPEENQAEMLAVVHRHLEGSRGDDDGKA